MTDVKKQLPNKKTTDVSTSAGQLYRDRLNKLKQTSSARAPGSGIEGSAQHRPRGTSPGGSARKNRKGHRPG